MVQIDFSAAFDRVNISDFSSSSALFALLALCCLLTLFLYIIGHISSWWMVVLAII